jgi:NAD(P)-dependent dehydrogenase (short-subunit alcohol dehydrogenase family)
VDAVCEQLGVIDILISNAALFNLARVVQITEASYDRLFAVIVRGDLFAKQTVAQKKIAQGRGGDQSKQPAEGERRRGAGRCLLRDQSCCD